MQTFTATSFEEFLNKHGEEAWSAVLTTLLRSVHEVDKTALQIWFAFYPLSLFQALQQADDPEKLSRQLLLQGKFWLKDQIDTSHKFLYGHRYWPKIKQAVAEHASSFKEATAGTLADQILQVASNTATRLKLDASLLIGITAVAFMTIQQARLNNFKATPGSVLIDNRHAGKSPEQVLRERAKDDGQGLLGFLRTVNKKWTVTYDENDNTA